jgi:hypothetical protein
MHQAHHQKLLSTALPLLAPPLLALLMLPAVQ